MSHYALVDALLPDTVRLAASNSEFYRELYRGHDVENVDRAKLAGLPVTEKKTFISAGKSRLNVRSDTISLANTSGSTGDFFLIHRDSEEERFIAEFFGRLAARNPSAQPTVVFALTLPSHGAPVSIPANVFVVQHCVIDDRTARNTVGYLGSDEVRSLFPRSNRVMHGALTQVLLLTKHCLTFGIDPHGFDIKEIVVSGEHLSGRVFKLLQNVWNAQIVNRYSLSEVFGGATSYGGSGIFTFDPYVYPEIINRSSSGAGELVLTALHPFVQKQPMIRYRTFDIFEPIGEAEFRHLGRRNHCLFSEGEPIIFGTELYNVLDDEPLLARETHSLGVSAKDHEATGKPLIRGCYLGKSDGYHKVRITVETRCDLSFFPRQGYELKERLNASIAALCRAPVDLAIDLEPRSGSGASPYEKAGMVWQYAE